MPSHLTPGNKGNKGGTGRPPNIIREMCREGIDVAAIRRVSDDNAPGTEAHATVSGFERWKWAQEYLARIGVPNQVETGPMEPKGYVLHDPKDLIEAQKN